MNQIEKLFADKLKNHKTEPSPLAWDRVVEELNKNSSKKAFPWLKVAAAIIILLLATFLIIQLNNNTEDLTNGEVISSTEKAPSAQEKQNSQEKDTVIPEVQPPQPLAENDQKAADARLVSDRPIQKDAQRKTKKIPVHKTVQSDPQTLAKAEPVEKLSVPDKLDSQSPDLQELPVEDPELLASAATAASFETVTVIYKSHEVEEQPEPKKKSRFLEVVQDIKNGELSLAELREAKNDLIASAIDKIGRDK